MLERLFSLTSKNTNGRTEAMAGITTFMMMTCILCVIPSILSAAEVNNLLALVLGALTVALGMGMPWQVALGAVFVSGLLFVVLTVTHIHQLMVEGISISLKHAITAGINHKKIRTCCV